MFDFWPRKIIYDNKKKKEKKREREKVTQVEDGLWPAFPTKELISD